MGKWLALNGIHRIVTVIENDQKGSQRWGHKTSERRMQRVYSCVSHIRAYGGKQVEPARSKNQVAGGLKG